MQRVDALSYRLAGGVGALADRFDALGRRAAIVGPHGSGKTSLLAALVPALATRGLQARELRLHRGDRRLGPAGERWLADAAPGVVLVLSHDLPPPHRHPAHRAQRGGGWTGRERRPVVALRP